MSQQGPSRRTKITKKRTYAKPGTLTSLVQQRQSFSTIQETLQAVRSEKKNLLRLIEKELPTADQQRGAPQTKTNEKSVEKQPTIEEQPIVEEQPQPTVEEKQIIGEQVEMDSTNTLQTNEQSKEQASNPPNQKNTRGTTLMPEVHARIERKLITLNDNNQPVGPTRDVVVELSSFLGTLARNATLCPLDILNWRLMDTKDDLWAYTKEKYDIHDAAQEWALNVIGSAWRRHKYNLKMLCYKPHASDEVLMSKRPPYVPECQLKELYKYWDSDKHKKMSETNTKNRKKWKNPHTCGKKSFALVRNDLEKKKESTATLKELFVVTRTRHPGHSYKDSNEDTISKIAAMEEIEKQQSADGSESVDAFSTVMGPEHPGCLRLYGRGVKMTSLKRKADSSGHVLTSTNDAVRQMQEKIQKMEEQMEEQRRTIQQDVTANIIAQLQRAGLISADILIALCVPSPREATSAPQANQGSEGEQRDETNEGINP